jgi:hypothetical protein
MSRCWLMGVSKIANQTRSEQRFADGPAWWFGLRLAQRTAATGCSAPRVRADVMAQARPLSAVISCSRDAPVNGSGRRLQ